MMFSLLSAYYQFTSRLHRICRSFKVSPNEITLDIGSGDSPFAPADVICEKFPWDDRERTAHMTHDRPLVAGDIEALPFKDKAFDFVHCSHVLEHTVHPDRAMKEIMRVGKRGYIEVPSAYFEKTIQSFPGHLWFVTEKNGRLHFTPKPRGILDEEVTKVSVGDLLGKDPLFKAFFFSRIYGLYHIEFFWDGIIPFDVQGEALKEGVFEKGTVDWSHGEAKPTREVGPAYYLKKWIRHRAEKAKTVRLDDLLACPSCRGPLTKAPTTYICAACRHTYAIRDNIPVLLLDALVPA